MIKLRLFKITAKKSGLVIFSQSFCLPKSNIDIINDRLTKFSSFDLTKKINELFLKFPPLVNMIFLTPNISVRPVQKRESLILETVKGEQLVGIDQLVELIDKIQYLRERLEGWQVIIEQSEQVRINTVVPLSKIDKLKFRMRLREVMKAIEVNFKESLDLISSEGEKASFNGISKLIKPILQDYIPIGKELLSESTQRKREFFEGIDDKIGLEMK